MTDLGELVIVEGGSIVCTTILVGVIALTYQISSSSEEKQQPSSDSANTATQSLDSGLATTYLPTPAQPSLSLDNNPFVSNLEYRVEDSLNIFEPVSVKDLKGTVIYSEVDELNVRFYCNLNAMTSQQRPFSWVVLRDPQNKNHYLIQPGIKRFPLGQVINIKEYWPIKENVRLMNNMLVYITN